MNPNPPNQLTILGGGATGMAAAFYAAKSGIEVELIEASPHLGGLLRTFPVGGTHLECFYHHFFTHDQEIHDLLGELGLSEEIVYAPTKMGLYRNGKASPFSTAWDLLKLPGLSLIGKFRFAATSLFLSRQRNWEAFENTSLLEWFTKWAGPEVTEMIWRPMLEIKFGDRTPSIPVSWMIGRLSQRIRSRRKGREELGYLNGSLQRLVDTLEKRLLELGVTIRKSTPVKAIEIEDGQIIGVTLDEETIRTSHVLSTLPPPRMASLLGTEASVFRSTLESVEYFGAICAVVITDCSLSEIYWLNVADPGFIFGGVIEQTNLLPPERYGGQHLTYLSRYTTPGCDLIEKSDQELKDVFLSDLLRLNPELQESSIKHCELFRTRTAAPVCDLNFSRRRPGISTPVSGLYLANMTDVYPDERSVNNSIVIAKKFLSGIGVAGSDSSPSTSGN